MPGLNRTSFSSGLECWLTFILLCALPFYITDKSQPFTRWLCCQISLALFRFASLAIMVIASIVAIFTDPVDSPTQKVRPPYLSMPVMVDFSGFGLVFSVGLFSQLFQHSVPNLIQPLEVRLYTLWSYYYLPPHQPSTPFWSDCCDFVLRFSLKINLVPNQSSSPPFALP